MSNFSLKYYPQIIHEGNENRENGHQLKKLLIVKQILFDSILGKYREFYVDNA